MGKGGGVGGGSGSGGDDCEQWPSKLRLAKDVISAGLPKDMTRRRPDDGEGERRWCRGGRRGGEGSSGTLVASSAKLASWAAAC